MTNTLRKTPLMDETGKKVNLVVDNDIKHKARVIRKARYKYLAQQYAIPHDDRRDKVRSTAKGNTTKAKQYAAAIHGDFPNQHEMAKALHGSSSKPDWSRAAMSKRVGLAEIGVTEPTLPKNATKVDHKASMRAANRGFTTSAAARRRSAGAHTKERWYNRIDGKQFADRSPGMSGKAKAAIGSALAVGGIATAYGIHRYNSHK